MTYSYLLEPSKLAIQPSCVGGFQATRVAFPISCPPEAKYGSSRCTSWRENSWM